MSGATSTQSSLIQQGVQRWESVIVGDVPSTSASLPAGACVNGGPAFSGTIDDIMVDVIITAIDGAGGILGQAGPCFVRDSDSLPYYGIILLDSADAADLVTNHYFGAVVVHEMGHILGLGTLWNYDRSFLDTSSSTDPRFTGANATAAWRAIGGTGFVPVESGGGGGTALSHWSESVFNNELMTGYLSASNLLSAITIGSMTDLGYRTNVAAADPYELLGISARQTAAALQFELAPIRPAPAPKG